VVRYIKQRKADEGEAWSGYRAVFEVNGLYNGPVTVFTRTEHEYKLYMNPDMWKVVTKKIDYVPVDPEEDDEFSREYKEVHNVDVRSGEMRVLDKRTSVEHKVAFALKGKFSGRYTAKLDDLVFNEDEERFEKPEAPTSVAI
jgi:hypothetical protein